MSHPHPELSPPGPLEKRGLRVIPLGGLGEVDADTGELTEPPDILVRGFEFDDNTFNAVVPLIEKTLAKAAAEGIGEQHQLEQLIRRTVSRWVRATYRRGPIVLPLVIDA